MKQRMITIVTTLVLSSAVALAQYTISTVAGTDRLRDGFPAVEVPLRYPNAVAWDGAGGFFIVDQYDERIRRVDASGIITTYVGVGMPGFVGEGGPARRAAINEVHSVAVDLDGKLYFADTMNFRVRMVDRSGTITTIAGKGNPWYGGDGGPARDAGLVPTAVAVDGSGNIYIADAAMEMIINGGEFEMGLGFRVRKVDRSGMIRTVVGTGPAGYSGDGGPATAARIGWIDGLAVDSGENLYLADETYKRIRKVNRSGIISTFAGNGRVRYQGDGVPAISASLDPTGLAVNNAGDVFVADLYNCRIRKIAADSGMISTVAGTGYPGLSGDGGPATEATLTAPTSVAIDEVGNLLIADGYNKRVRRVTADGRIQTVAGTDIGDGGLATDAFLYSPSHMAIHSSGDLYFADTLHNRVRKVTPAGIILTVAGNGLPAYSDGRGSATLAYLKKPAAVAFDAQGHLYIADGGNRRIRKVTPAGRISTIAGTGEDGFSGDGGQAIRAKIGIATSVAVDRTGNIYFNDEARIRKVTPAGIITTIAGNGKKEAAGDGGPATQAQLDPFDLAFDSAGNLYVADGSNHRIRKIDTSGIITTVAGNGVEGFSGDGGLAVNAALDRPTGVALDADDNLYIADYDNLRVRRVSKDGVITTIAGNGNLTISGDGGPALEAGLDPTSVVVDSDGIVYVSDLLNDRIRKLTPAPPFSANAVVGDNQTGLAGDALPEPLTVWITGPDGAPAAGKNVVFTVTEGSATLNPTSAMTSADGSALTNVTLGDTPGTVTITASLDGVPVATFSLTVEAAGTRLRITAGGVVSAGLSSPQVKAISPNAIMSVFGEGFASEGTVRILSADDLEGGKVPASLAGVCVEVGRERAPIFVVTPTQINFQAPRLQGIAADVHVVTGCGTGNERRSNAERVVIRSVAPEFFYFLHAHDGKNPIAAVNAITGAYIGAPGLLPGANFTPAKPGDVLTLFLTGLGVTNPAFGPGELPDQIAAVAAVTEVTLGGVPLPAEDLLYAGVTPGYAGLYQLNLRVPEGTPDGDLPLVILVRGVASPGGAYITVSRSGTGLGTASPDRRVQEPEEVNPSQALLGLIGGDASLQTLHHGSNRGRH